MFWFKAGNPIEAVARIWSPWFRIGYAPVVSLPKGGFHYLKHNMLLTIQFPIADSRKFIDRTGVLLVPKWPSPDPDREFVRYFGKIKSRKQGGIPTFGENAICEARQAVRFPQHIAIHQQAETGTRLRCVYK